MKHLTPLLTVAALIAVLVGGYAALDYTKQRAQSLSGYVASTVTNTSSTVNMTDTLVYAGTVGLQYFYGVNTGAGNIDCAFTSTSTLTGAVVGTGLRFEASTYTTSTKHSNEITDPSLLGKYMHCVANTTSTLGILKYANY
jgi:hypothetical protein